MAGNHNTWTESELQGVYQEYMAGARPSGLAKRRGYLSAELLFMFTFRKWPLRGRASRLVPKRISDAVIQLMHAEYMSGMTLNEVARRHQRGGRALRDLFSSRGLFIRNSAGIRAKGSGGRFEGLSPKSEAEVDEIISGATRLIIPPELKHDWSKWPMARRGEFIARLRDAIPDPKARPELPFSANVVPFDYTTEAAWEIIRRRNSGLCSWYWETKLNIMSQGVIWDGRLWFWARRIGCYVEGIKWSPQRTRNTLSREIWQASNGPIPPQGVIRERDGNPNNLDPANLVLSDKNEVMRENQARHHTKKSRELTTILLNRHQTTDSHGHPDPIDIRTLR